MAFPMSSGFSDSVRADTEWLGSYESRMVGMASHDRATSDLVAKINAIPGVEAWPHRFELLAPVVDRADLTVSGGQWAGVHKVYPIYPTHVRLSTTPPGGISGELVYIGEGNPDEAPARSLRGQIAVMEVTGQKAWEYAANLGARAVILLGSSRETTQDFLAHVIGVPVDMPRFYVPEGELAEALRAGSVGSGTLFSAASWQEVTATNVYALVKPEAGAEPRRCVAVVTPYDCASMIPELSTGADVAVDAALNLNFLKHYAQERPARPLLFCFVDAFGIAQLGTREMMVAFASTTREKEIWQREDEKLLDGFSRDAKLVEELEQMGDVLANLYRPKFQNLRTYLKDEVSREVVAIETVMQPLRLKLYRIEEGPEKESIQERVAKLDARRKEFFRAQKAALSGEELSEPDRELVDRLWSKAKARIEGQMEAILERFRIDEQRDEMRFALREKLGLGEGVERPIAFMFGIDISDAGVAVGPSLYGGHYRKNDMANTLLFRQWLQYEVRQREEGLWPKDLQKAINLAPLTGVDATNSHNIGEVPLVTAVAQSFGTADVSWATLDALRTKVDTNRDRVENLEWDRLNPQIEATAILMDLLAQDRDFAEDKEVSSEWSRMFVSIVDLSPGEPVPSVPMEGYLTTLDSGAPRGESFLPGMGPASPGIRREVFQFTGIDGRAVFDAIPEKIFENNYFSRMYYVQSFKLNEWGKIVRAVDLLKAGKSVKLDSQPVTARKPLRAIPFDCEGVFGYQFIDPRFLMPLPNASVLDARRTGKPQRMNMTLTEGVLSCFLAPDTYWQLILRAGITRNRMCLFNMQEAEETRTKTVRESMIGFPTGEPFPEFPIYQAAQDFLRLDSKRLKNYRSAGIISKAIDDIHAESRDLFEKATEAKEADNGADFYRYSNAALGNEVRAYHAIREMANDVIRGAIFLLLMLVPFAFVMERLLVATPHVYRQLVSILIIFTIMTGILWSFHPAFRITSQPLMILMSFAIIFMSLLVIGMVYSKFEVSLEELRSGRAEASGARTSRVGVATTAFKLGVANLRKRKMRTALTGITVVLVTFALLCFTSTSNYSGQKELNIGVKPTYQGVLIQQPGLTAMPAGALRLLRYTVSEEYELAPRYWWYNPNETDWRIHVRNPETGNEISLTGGIGISPSEDRVTGIGQMLPNWSRFAEGDACYISQLAAERLELGAGDSLIVGGKEVEIAGLYDSSEFDQNVLDLDGQSLMPIDMAMMDADKIKGQVNKTIEVLIAEMESGASFQSDEELTRMTSDNAIILSDDFIRGLGNIRLMNVAVHTETDEESEALANALAKRLAFPIYYSMGDTVRAVATTPLIPMAPRSLFITLVIAGLIIFNTMLSSIAERRGEIHIYTSLGLAPLHVGFLFLAEAITYGLMGSIFGYVVGQGVATVFSELGLMGGLTLNYSGTQTIAVMFMVMAVVIISSLVPAFLAGKMAVPSNKMSWDVPEPKDNRIEVVLPFTVNSKTANGVIAFLMDYFEIHRDGNIGHFSTDNLNVSVWKTEGLDALMLEGTIWLSPYDLGVRQDVNIRIDASRDADVFAINLILDRKAGQMGSWQNLNKVFISDLRKQLLGWRKLKADHAWRYIRDGEAMMEKARKDENGHA